MTAPNLDKRGRAIVEALNDRPMGVADLAVVLNLRKSDSIKKALKARLVALDGMFGVEAVYEEDGARLWRRTIDPVSFPALDLDGLASPAVGRCRVNGKHCYASAKQARKAMHQIRAQIGHGVGKTKPERVYECPWCGAWHLTHEAQRSNVSADA